MHRRKMKVCCKILFMYKRSTLFKKSSFSWKRNDIFIKTFSNLKLRTNVCIYIMCRRILMLHYILPIDVSSKYL